jgi:hypothetical protein
VISVNTFDADKQIFSYKDALTITKGKQTVNDLNT